MDIFVSMVASTKGECPSKLEKIRALDGKKARSSSRLIRILDFHCFWWPDHSQVVSIPTAVQSVCAGLLFPKSLDDFRDFIRKICANEVRTHGNHVTELFLLLCPRLHYLLTSLLM